jgi:hypothetical protein
MKEFFCPDPSRGETADGPIEAAGDANLHRRSFAPKTGAQDDTHQETAFCAAKTGSPMNATFTEAFWSDPRKSASSAVSFF